MKRSRALALIVIAICFFGCSNAQQPRTDATASPLDRKVLIVYLSRTNNTKVVAEFIHDEVGGTLVPLELEQPYPADYQNERFPVSAPNAHESGSDWPGAGGLSFPVRL